MTDYISGHGIAEMPEDTGRGHAADDQRDVQAVAR